MNNISLKGVGVAMITPFTKDRQIDFNALKKLTKNLVNSQADYLTVLGTTAETATLTNKEKELVIRTILEENKNTKPIVLGVGGNDTLALAKQIKELSKIQGISAILSVSPYYNKPSQQGLVHHYCEIADVSHVPIILYNVPGRTGSNINVETVLKLSEHDNILGIKEASGNLSQGVSIIKYKPSTFLFISGDDDLILAQMALGADGIISVIANAYPNEMAAIVNKGLFDNPSDGRRNYYSLIEVIRLIFEEGNPVGIKCLLKHLRVCSNYVRLPLTPASDELDRKIEQAIEFM